MTYEQEGHEGAVQEFRALLTQAGLEVPAICVDGAIHRFGEKKSAWYTLQDDGAAVFGNYGDWRDHDDANGWHYFEHVYQLADDGDAAEASRIRREQSRLAHSQHQEEAHAEARTRAQALWDAAKEGTGDHPYLQRKEVGAHGTRMTQESIGGLSPPLLVIPFYAVDKTLHTLQFIDSEGGKRWLSGGSKQGHYYRLAGKSDCLFIAEGFATAAGIQEATGYSAVMAGDKGNLAAVATALRSRLPDMEIVIAADTDAVESAEAAARAVGGRVVVPVFPDGMPGTDFNDLVRAIGAQGTAKQLLEETGPDIWADLEPLPSKLPPVPPFPPELLPAGLSTWLTDIADRMQCPLDFPAIAAMTCLGAVVGRQIAIRPKRYDSWSVVPNLWGMVIGRPGVMKSHAIRYPLQPLELIEAGARAQYEEELQEYEIQLTEAKVSRKEAESELRRQAKTRFTDSGTFAPKDPMSAEVRHALLSNELVEPTWRRYKTSDATVEKLGELLAANPSGMLLFRDELAGFLAKLDREDKGSDRAFYLEAWNGDGSFTYDRIGRGTVHIDACCLSVLGGIQPDKLHTYLSNAMRGGMGGDGLIQRFQLAVWPDVDRTWKNVDRAPDGLATASAHVLVESLARLDTHSVDARRDADDAVPYLRFTDDAQVIFDEWRAGLEARLRSDDEHPVMEAHLSKYRSLIPSLALLLHLANSGKGAVGSEVLLQALAWGEYLEAHARRIFSAATGADVMAAKEFLKRIKSGELPDSFRLRDVYRHHWHLLGSKEEALKAADVLVDFDYLVARTENTGGRSTVRYQVNPKARTQP